MRRIVRSRSGAAARAVGSLPLVALLLAGCGEGAAPEAEMSAPPLEGLHFDTLATVESAAGAAFGGVWDLAAAADGSFAVLDATAPAVHLFSADAAHLASIATEGFQMGELSRPTGIGFSDAGDLFVWDPGNRRVSRYASATAGAAFLDMRSADAFGETGFCVLGSRIFLSYLLNEQVIHEIGPDGGLPRSFSEAPTVAGIDGVSEWAVDMAREDLSPAKLLCLADRILEVGAFQPRIRLHDPDGGVLWSVELDPFTPVLPVSPDDMGVGFEYAEGTGSHMTRSVVRWSESTALIQYEMRLPGARPAGADFHALESVLIDLNSGAELGRTRSLPLFLGANGDRFYAVRQTPVPQVLVLERHAEM